MPKAILSIDEFASQVSDLLAPLQARTVRAVSGVPDLANSNGRIVRYLFSDPSVGRDRHTITGWKLDNFERNPVFLWAHQSDEPPIGRVIEIENSNGTLRGAVEYVEKDIYPFADTVLQLVRGGFINAVSTSWDPIDWKFSTDRARPGGIDFKLVDLLEVSQVPVPALPTALATARSNGIDTGPLYEWAEKILDKGGMILIPRQELETLRKEAKMPARRTSKSKAKTEAEIAAEQAAARTAKLESFKRDLYQVAWLAYLLSDLDCLEEMVEWEAAIEEDGSTLPDQLAAAKKMLGDILIAMAGEEVAEMNAEEDSERSAVPAGKCSIIGFLRGLRKDEGSVRAFEAALQAHLEGQKITFVVGNKPARAGKVLSSANEKTLRDAHDMMMRGCDMVRGVFEQNDPEDNVDAGDDDAAERATRARRARAVRHRVELN